MCDACHMPSAEGRRALRFEGNVSRLCQSCHEGRLAKREVHPVDVAPSEAILRQMPSGFPLADGKMTCLTCHDLAWGCTTEPPAGMPSRNSLRGDRVANPLAFCFGCHAQASYSSLNVHDQLEAGKPKADVAGGVTPTFRIRILPGSKGSIRTSRHIRWDLPQLSSNDGGSSDGQSTHRCNTLRRNGVADVRVRNAVHDASALRSTVGICSRRQAISSFDAPE